jgi:hypothetical protein
MGAKSVTGVSGPGMAYNLKGPLNKRSFNVPQVCPHVVMAGEVALVGGTKTVTLPAPLAGSQTGYVVIVTPRAANLAYVSAKTNNGDGDFASFVITGTGTDVVGWMVVKAGMGLDVVA